MRKRIKIVGRSYILSPLRCKYLRRLTEEYEEQRGVPSIEETIQMTLPYILESLRECQPWITNEVLDEMIVEEMNDVFKEVIKLSGMTLSKKETELLPETDEDEVRGIDWAGIYSRICCLVGMTYREIDEHTMNEVNEILKYLTRHPTSAEILAAVYEVKPKYGSTNTQTEREFEQNFNQFSQLPGLEQTALPPELKANLNWAQELAAKYRKAVS